MAENLKGITIQIGGDTTGLDKALSNTNKEINSTQKELNAVEKLLKFDPSNTELLAQKQKLLGTQVGNVKDKLNTLKEAQKQLDAEMKSGGDVNQAQYRALQREIASTESQLKKVKQEQKDMPRTC